MHLLKLAAILTFLLPPLVGRAGVGSTRQALDATAQRIREAGDVTVQFTATAANGSDQQGTIGTIRISGQCFHLQTPEMQTWFDGKTQWSLVTGDTEVSMMEPSAEELQAMNPYAFLSIYKQGFNYKLQRIRLKDGMLKGYLMTLTAQDKQQDLREMKIETDTDYNLRKVSLRQADGQQMHIEITAIRPHQSFAPADFTFPKDQYPQCTVIDLR